MPRAFPCLVVATVAALFALPAARAAAEEFYPVEVVIDAGEKMLAAYQIELAYDKDAIHLVGIEGGEAVFRGAPFFDPKGLDTGRIVLAAFTTAGDPPKGRVRVARVHIAQKPGTEARLRARLVLAATTGGVKIEARIDLISGKKGESEKGEGR